MGLLRRDIAGDVTTFPSTFSSFDNCMSKNICKIPFIVICVVGGLIIFTILWCFLRCCLCGYRCCTCCCGGCGGRREKQKSQSDREILQPPPIIVQQPAYHQPPQYAYFDSHNDDALPVMPSFEKTQRVEISVKEEHEMGPIDSKGYGYNQPQTDLHFPKNGLQHPNPIRGYDQNRYDRQLQHPPNLGLEPSTHSTIPPVLQNLGNLQSGTTQSDIYHEPSKYSQQLQPTWNGHGNAYNGYQSAPSQYQGPQNQYGPNISNYHNQQRQEEWTVV